MNFHHLAYWQDKALSLAIENRLFINGEYTAAAENETFETVGAIRSPVHRWRKLPAARASISTVR